jgi:HSP20 family protein
MDRVAAKTPRGDQSKYGGTTMKSITVYDSLLPAFRGVFRADPFDILDSVFDGSYFPAAAAVARCPAVDVREKDGRYLIEAELPGISEKDLKLELKDGRLTLSTERKEEEKEEMNSTWIRRERRESRFSRSFELPEDADGERIEARFKDGLLTVELPKKPAASPRLVQVKVA